MAQLERCMGFVGGSVGCATFCTKIEGHAGPCVWDGTAQELWNQIASLRRSVLALTTAPEENDERR